MLELIKIPSEIVAVARIFAEGKPKPQGSCVSCVKALLEDEAWLLLKVLFPVQLREEEAGLSA